MPYSRRFEFDGADADYIRYLEERIFALETCLNHPSRQEACIEVIHRSRGQDSQVSSQNGEFGAFTSRRSGEISTRNGQRENDGAQRRSETKTRPNKQRHDNTEEADSRTGLKIIEFDPLSQLQKSSRARSDIQENRRTKSEYELFLKTLPPLKDWTSPVDETQRKIILRGLIPSYASATPICTSSNGSRETQLRISAQPVDIIPILDQFRLFTASSSSLDRKIMFFRELVFVSTCAVALEVYDDIAKKDQIYEIMRDFRGCDAQSNYLRRLVGGAKWANRAISLLSQTEWSSRSWGVIFAGRSVASFDFSH